MPIIAALIPLIGQLLPDLIGHLFGPNKEAVAQKVVDVTSAVFGTTDPMAIKAAMADPNKALDYKMKLADIQNAENQRLHDERMAELQDVANARTSFSANASVFWLGIVVLVLSYAIVAAVGYGMYVLLTEGLKIQNVNTVALVFGVIGSLAQFALSEAGQVTRFFFGSSAGSAAKTDQFGAALSKLATGLVSAPGKKVAAIAGVGLALMLWPAGARAHDWYTPYKTPGGVSCCGGKDCHELPDAAVRHVATGYAVKLPGSSPGTSQELVIPFERAQPSEDEHFHICIWGGQPQCFFAPPLGT